MLKELLGWGGERIDSSLSFSNFLVVKLTTSGIVIIIINVYIPTGSSQYYDVDIWLQLELLFRGAGFEVSKWPHHIVSFNARMGPSLSNVSEQCGILEEDSLDLDYWKSRDKRANYIALILFRIICLICRL